jgi:exopolyphosphatase/guanosine-5'-triphosphate,3'-diphosphate pyrophosphatase
LQQTVKPTAAEPELVASVDLGSNSFHMLVAQVDQGQLRVLDKLRESVRLESGLGPDRCLTSEARARALDCLERFGQRLRGDRLTVRAVGTNTLRRARDSRQFLAEAEQALGHGIEVIAGIEEARLIYLGVAHSLADEGGQRLVVDIGGGSTELIIGERFQPRHLESLHMGCISMGRCFFGDGRIGQREWERAMLAARGELAPLVQRYRDLGWQRAVGASGTAKALGAIMLARGWSSEGITRSGLEQLRDQLIEAGGIAGMDLKCLSEDRRPLLPGGLVVMLSIFEALGIERMDVADGGLREGLLYDVLGRIHHEDVRSASVAGLMGRYHVDPAQAARVAASARLLLEGVASAWGLEDPEHGQWLEWAARLHEIGLDIAHSQYHKHGAYVLRNADLAGFSRQEQLLLASLVRSHRRKFATAEYKELPESWQQPAQRLTVLLRLAVLLHRARTDERPPSLVAGATDGALRLEFPPEWLAPRVLLRADLGQEAELLRPAGFELSF